MSSLLIVTVFLAVTVLSNSAQAILLKTETSNKTFENAKLVKSVVLVNDDKTEVSMKAVSYGLRKKAVMGFVPVSIYVLQLLTANPEKIKKEAALSSLPEAGPLQLHFTFARTLAGEKISSSFKEGLQVNGVNTEKLSTELGTVMKEISNITEFKEGQNFAITFTWTGESATVHITDPSARIISITGPKLFAEQLLSIWFGKTTDSRLEDLKKTLLK
jgi:hypothetical protein